MNKYASIRATNASGAQANLAPVDVLAYLQALEREIPASANFASRRTEAIEARAAVAELIEAANAGEPRMTRCGDRRGIYFYPEQAEKLLAALARCGGAK